MSEEFKHSMSAPILDWIRRYPHTTFAEMMRRVDGFKGDVEMTLEGFVLWSGLSQEAADAIWELREKKLITLDVADSLVYMLDGYMLTIPVAKSARKTKTPRWIPVTFTAVTISKSEVERGL
jgi:hypothetical protein